MNAAYCKLFLRHFAKRQRRGFTLIEVAIVMVLVGVILGGVLVPTYEQAKKDANDREAQQLNTIKTAIYGYAVSKTTRGNAQFNSTVDIFAVSDGSRGRRWFSLPRGRPYLPCPDVNGDGYEDRIDYDATGFLFTPPTGARVSVIAAGSPDAGRTLYLTDFAANATAQPLAEIGSCATSRGLLPWRTLGVPPADTWGNLYTYYADAIASDSLVGFNQNTNIDQFDARSPIRPVAAGSITNFLAFGERQATTTELNRNNTTITVNNYNRPLMVCDGLPCATLTVSVVLREGEILTNSINVLYRNFEPRDVRNGVPFAVVSHGRNGLAGVNYQTLLSIKYSNVALQFKCNDFIEAAISGSPPVRIPEFYNAANVESEQISSVWRGAAAAGDGRCTTPANTGGSSGVLVYLPQQDSKLQFSRASTVAVTTSYDLQYDDVMIWASMGEIIDVMQQNEILPAPDLVVLRAY